MMIKVRKNECGAKNKLTYTGIHGIHWGKEKRIDFLAMDEAVKIIIHTAGIPAGFLINPADLRKFLDDNFPEREIIISRKGRSHE